jgi:hypothetical protein
MEAVTGGRVMEWLACFYHIIAGISHLLAAVVSLFKRQKDWGPHELLQPRVT